MKLKAVVHKDEDGGFWAEVPALRGCITQGDTMDELRFNLNEAMTGWLECANDRHELGDGDEIIEIEV